VAKRSTRTKQKSPQRTAEEQQRQEVVRRLRREKRTEREIHALIGQLMKATYQRQQRLLQLASAIVGKDFKIVPAVRGVELDADAQPASTV
jgi:hypothetical protein